MAMANFKEICTALAIKKRCMAAAAALLSAMSSGQGPQGEKQRTERCQFSWENHMGRLTESEFKLRYKVTVHAFY